MGFNVKASLFLVVAFFVFPHVSGFLLSHFGGGMSRCVCIVLVIFLASLLTRYIKLRNVLNTFFTKLILGQLVPGGSTLVAHVRFIKGTVFVPFFLVDINVLVGLQMLFSD